MGTQDSTEVVTEVGVAFWKGKVQLSRDLHHMMRPYLAYLTYLTSSLGFALGDLMFYIPILGFGLLTSNCVALSAALGVTVYWTIGKLFVFIFSLLLQL